MISVLRPGPSVNTSMRRTVRLTAARRQCGASPLRQSTHPGSTLRWLTTRSDGGSSSAFPYTSTSTFTTSPSSSFATTSTTTSSGTSDDGSVPPADLHDDTDGGAVTSLTDILTSQILTRGPLSVAEFMRQALSHPHLGYYMTRDVFGQRGDFTTSPEISQLFGELLGVWCVAMWQQMGQPDHVELVELGPGRGTLMAVRACV